MRPTLFDHHIALTEALNSPVIKEQTAIRESIPLMYLLNVRCDCIAVLPKKFRFRVALDYCLIKNNEIPAHEDVTVFVDVQRTGDKHEVTVKA